MIPLHSKDTVCGGPKCLFSYTYNTFVTSKSGQPLLKVQKFQCVKVLEVAFVRILLIEAISAGLSYNIITRYSMRSSCR